MISYNPGLMIWDKDLKKPVTTIGPRMYAEHVTICVFPNSLRKSRQKDIDIFNKIEGRERYIITEIDIIFAIPQ